MTDRTARASAQRGDQLPRRHGLWRLLRANLYDLRLLLSESWVVLAAFLIVTLVGTLYLRLGYDPCRYDADPATIGCTLTISEALYETIKLQTLQSGLAFPGDSLAGELVFFIIPLLGLVLIFQGVLNFGRLLLDKGSRREAWQIALASTYRDHVIVCGLGRVGMRTVQQLIDAGHQPVVVERDWGSEFVERAVNASIPVVVGDAREPLTLRRAGLMRARAVVAAINDDLLNVEIALTVRAMRPQLRQVLRVFSEDLDQNLERTFGRNAAFSASALAAPTFAAAAVSRHVEYLLPTGGALLGVTQMTIERDSKLSGFVQAAEARGQFRVLQHVSAFGRVIVPGDLRTPIPLSAGDQVTLIGSIAALEQARADNHLGGTIDFAQVNWPQHPDAQRNTVIVCGLGKVGYRVVRQLHAQHPRPRIVVVRLANGREDFPHRIAQLDGVETVIGDAREVDVLRAAGIDEAFSVAALTSDDLLNLQIALAARRARADIHVVLRVFSDALADKLGDMFGIRTTYSTSALASPTMAAAALVGGTEHGLTVAGSLYATQRVGVSAGDRLAGSTVAELRSRHALLAIEIWRAHDLVTLPSLDSRLEAGDQVTVLGPIEMVAKIGAHG